MWTDQIENFKSNAHSSFRFLTEERGFDEPKSTLFRDLSIDFEQPESGWRVSIAWERSWFIPLVSLDATESEETATHQLSHLLRLLEVSVDSETFPICDRLSRKLTPGFGDMWTHFRKKPALLLEYPLYLDANAQALRHHYDALWDLACDPATPVWQLRI